MPKIRTSPPPRGERRSAPRKAFPREVRASRGPKSSGLVATDLSPAGMRVAPNDVLELGDVLSLALHDPEGSGVRVQAVVARDDGDQGWMLQFRELSAETAARLEALIGSLPDLDESADAGVVISEILRHEEQV